MILPFARLPWSLLSLVLLLVLLFQLLALFYVDCAGDIETGVDHLSNAVAVCGQPQQLLQVLQQTLPPQVFQMLLMKLPVAGQVR